MKSYVPTLDGLRALAAIAVIAFHVKIPVFSGGYLGVDVFFVLSGYLTASIFINGSDTHTLKSTLQFLNNRMRRIWPLLATVSAIVTIVLFIANHKDLFAFELGPAVLFLGNLTAGSKWLAHTWTLATEMQFYISLAFIFLVGAKLGNKPPLFVLVFCFIGVLSYRTVSIALDADWFSVYNHPFSHSSGLFLGAILAVTKWRPSRAPEVWAAVSTTMICIAIVFAVYRNTQSFAFWVILTEISTAILIASLLVAKRGIIQRVLGNRFMITLGIWSYGIYLWHYPIARIARENLTEVSAFFVTFGASVILAAITHKLIEKTFYSRPAKNRTGPQTNTQLLSSTP